ncbi:MAG: hypothetical protein JWR69_4476 [Pedosphaera sp.]|nr:hypothetical protein [Pedosphaera sp.]
MKPKNSAPATASSVNRNSYRWVAFVGGLGLALGACFLGRSRSSPTPTAVVQEIHGESISSPPPLDPAANRPALSAKQPSTNDAPANSVNAPELVGTQAQGEYFTVGFDTLSDFVLSVTNQMVDPIASFSVLKIAGTIPDSVQSLDEKKVAVKGFMLPIKLEEGRVTEFILLKNRMMCCFGLAPRINEWVSVRMAGKGEKATMDHPVIVSGTLHVAEIRRGAVPTGIYRLDGDKIEMPLGLP